MPLPVAHALLGATVTDAGFSPDRNALLKRYLIGAVIAVLPDFDLFFSWILGFGDRWHGKVTHSILFAILLGMLAAGLGGMWNRRAVIVFSCAALSHGILDALTHRRFGGSALLWPLSTHRFRLGWFDYFAFYPASRLEPLQALVKRAFVISGYEFLIFGGLFAMVFLLHRAIGKRSLRRGDTIKQADRENQFAAD
jgi:hypothetical protein